MAQHNELGKQGEDLAAAFLAAKGYHVLDRNYRFLKSELDIVVLDMERTELVFVEVKTRSRSQEMPEMAVTPAKQQLIFRAADAYIYERQMRTVPVRFDIVAVHLDNPAEPMFHHIEDAFRMDGASFN